MNNRGVSNGVINNRGLGNGGVSNGVTSTSFNKIQIMPGVHKHKQTSVVPVHIHWAQVSWERREGEEQQERW